MYCIKTKIASISKAPESLKGHISKTLCGKNTKFGSNLPERVLITSKVLLWFYISESGNHGNQDDLK